MDFDAERLARNRLSYDISHAISMYCRYSGLSCLSAMHEAIGVVREAINDADNRKTDYQNWVSKNESRTNHMD